MGLEADSDEDDGHDGAVDRDSRGWLRSLAVAHSGHRQERAVAHGLSKQAADYLERIAHDGTLKAALAEIGAGDPALAG